MQRLIGNGTAQFWVIVVLMSLQLVMLSSIHAKLPETGSILAVEPNANQTVEEEASLTSGVLLGAATEIDLAELIEGAWQKGTSNAPVVIVEFGDFECPYCTRAYDILKVFLDRYQADVQYVFKHFPLANIHPNAVHAAVAAECAGLQGAFWPMHDRIFEYQLGGGTLSREVFYTFAADLSLNAAYFKECFDNEITLEKVREDYEIKSGSRCKVASGRVSVAYATRCPSFAVSPTSARPCVALYSQ